MSDNRKYYYLKLKENFYNSETMVILESMQDGLLYSNLLLKMYLMSLKSGGILMLNDHLPHTPQTIATFTRHQVGTVERALKVFAVNGVSSEAEAVVESRNIPMKTAANGSNRQILRMHFMIRLLFYQILSLFILYRKLYEKSIQIL